MIDEQDIYNAKEKETSNTKCPSCGAEMVFYPEACVLKCEHCGTTQEFEVSHAAEQSFEKLLAPENTWGSETHVFRCNNCGAKAIIAKDEIAKECAFCGTTNIVATEELSGIKPNALVPFKISKETAAERLALWAKKKIFAPKAFKKGATPEEIKGVYSPAFTFDTNTDSNYAGVLGKNYTTTTRINGKTVTVTKVRYFNVSGTFHRFFDDVLVQSSSTIAQKTVNKLGGFDTNDSKAYKSEFLSGYTAEQYSRDGRECWEEAKGLINKKLKQEILAQYDYDVVKSLNISTGYFDITHKYVLLPIYVGHCNFRSKLYNFFVNGYSGKVIGKAPLQPVKVGIAVVLALAVLAGIGFCAYWFFLR